ncbi:MAG TPA: glycosyltransferase family 9 protein [Candidatus Binatia bacterium]|jgi:lipopolysaccharide heptosyltransferase II
MTPAPLAVEPKKILILLHGSIGDVTRALPLAGLLRRRFPKANLAWSVEPAALPLVELCRAVDEIILFDRPRGVTAFWRFLNVIRARRFDLVLDLQRHLKSGLISRWSGAPDRLGFHRSDAKEFNWLFNNRYIAATGNNTPKILHYMKFAEYLGIDPRPIEWNLQLTAEDYGRAERLLGGARRDIGVLFVGSRWESKLWFAAQIAAAAAEIRRRHGLDVVFLGASADRALGNEAQARVQGNVINLVGRTSLRDAVAIIARARFCLGPDTGLMHIAAALGTPVISLWGATDPARTGPYGFGDLVILGKADCSPCYRKRCSIGRICMQSIDVGAILAMIDKALARHQTGRNVPKEVRVSIY